MSGLEHELASGHVGAVIVPPPNPAPFMPSTDSPEIFVIGGANMDLSGQASAAFQMQESNLGQVAAHPGGVGRNIAEALARLGRKVGLLSVLGHDGFAADILRQTRDAGVDMSACLLLSDQTTCTYLSLLDHLGEMIGAINDMAAMDALDSEQLGLRFSHLDRADAWVIDANLSTDALAYLLAHAGGRPIFAEPVSAIKAQRLAPYLDRFYLMKPNLAEARVLAALPETADVETVIKRLHDKGLPRLVLSQGREGLIASEAGSAPYHLPAPKVSVASVTGAGDTLMAGLVDGLLAGLPLPEALNWARAAASLSLQSARAVCPNLSTSRVRQQLEAQRMELPS